MTPTGYSPASRKEALVPDITTLDERSIRAWTEQMAVRQLDGGRYAVDCEGDDTCIVDLPRGACSCPIDDGNEEHCRHLRRVAIEINLKRVPPPNKRFVECASCGTEALADADERESSLCEECHLSPGDLVTDRETGDTVRVVAVTEYRAHEVEIPDRGYTVAEHPTNGAYDATDVVVDVLYPNSGAPSKRRVYSFPRARLARVDGDDESMPSEREKALGAGQG